MKKLPEQCSNIGEAQNVQAQNKRSDDGKDNGPTVPKRLSNKQITT